MTSNDAATPTLTRDPQLQLLAELSRIATTVLGDHVNDAGLCAVCGSAWPCDRAKTAEHNLAVP